MSKNSSIGIFYGSSTGNTETIAILIKEYLTEYTVDLYDVAQCSVEKIQNYSHIIFGVSTWGVGDIQDDFEEFLIELTPEMLQNKTIAFYGLGDQNTYTDCFADALGKLFNRVNVVAMNHIGKWKNEGYTFQNSSALVNGHFVGLVIDEDNQEELTKERVKKWAFQLKEELA